MSILRRKGKQYRGRKGNEKENIGRGAKFNFELLSGDIHTLLQVFHDEANGGDVSTVPSIQSFYCVFTCLYADAGSLSFARGASNCQVENSGQLVRQTAAQFKS